MTSIAGGHAIVTGGSSGIGLATARRLARRGARVSLVARDQARLDAAAEQIASERSPGSDEVSVGVARADVRNAPELHSAIERLVAGRGPCDILVTASGGAHPGYFEELDEAVFRDQMDIDYFGTLHAVRAVVGPMRAQRRGHLVLISSTAALLGVFGYTAYAPAKAAVRSLAETLRPELAPDGVVVSCAYPPDTRTPGLDRENAMKPAETAAVSATIQPRDPDDVARAIMDGIERDRLVITVDFQTAALTRAARFFDPYARWTIDRAVRKARGPRGTFGT
jgi:3-dehydrosphinganine reductase